MEVPIVSYIRRTDMVIIILFKFSWNSFGVLLSKKIEKLFLGWWQDNEFFHILKYYQL